MTVKEAAFQLTQTRAAVIAWRERVKTARRELEHCLQSLEAAEVEEQAAHDQLARFTQR